LAARSGLLPLDFDFNPRLFGEAMRNNRVHLRPGLSRQRVSQWFLSVGLFLAFLGLLAIFSSFTATRMTMLLFGALLLFAGLAEGGHALIGRGVIFKSRLFSGALYAVVGLMLLIDPVGGAIGLTLLIGLLLLASGFMRLLVGLSLVRLKMTSGWHLLVGSLNMVLAILILLGWPETGNWLIGFVIGLELLLAGVITAFATRGVRTQTNRWE